MEHLLVLLEGTRERQPKGISVNSTRQNVIRLAVDILCLHFHLILPEGTQVSLSVSSDLGADLNNAVQAVLIQKCYKCL